MNAYSGIGSRNTPPEILKVMTIIAGTLQNKLILRSGAAPGADFAFELGVTNGNKEIYIPWKGFAKSDSKLYNALPEAEYIASLYHPNWKFLKEPVKKLMARNVHQVLGKDLKSPAKFVLCWTPDGCQSHQSRSQKTGGTGQAISIASENNVPVINMKNLMWEECFEEMLMDII